jgi:hypothetical protein
MYNFTTLKNAKIADINGLVQTESEYNFSKRWRASSRHGIVPSERQ